MSYRLRNKEFLLSDSRSGLLTMFGCIALGTGLMVMFGTKGGPDVRTMMQVGAGISALGAALLAAAWLSLRRRQDKWSRLLNGPTVPGRVLSRVEVPGKYGGTLLTFEHSVGGTAYRTKVQGKQLVPALASLQQGDTVEMVVDPDRPQDARMRDWIAQPV